MKSTNCDDCGAEIPLGTPCWMVSCRRADTDGTPVVKVICNACHEEKS